MSSERKSSVCSVRSDVSWIKESSSSSFREKISSSENNPENIGSPEIPVRKQVSQFNDGKSPSRSTKALGPPKCYLCSKNVYKVEEVLAISKTWHKGCFKCGGNATNGCQKVLALGKYLVHDDEPYCESCYSKLYRPKGFGFANTLSVYSDALDVEKARETVSAPVTPVTEPLRSVKETKLAFSTPTTPVNRPSDTMSVDSSNSTSAKKKAFNLGGALAPKCCSCQKSVFKVEEIIALGLTWHKACFKCGGTGGTDGCGRTVTLDKYLDRDGQPYCKGCYGKISQPKGNTAASETGMTLPDEETKS